METFTDALAKHPFFEGLDHALLELIASCASDVSYEAGQMIYHEGEEGDHFLLVQQGKVSIEIFAGGRGSISIQTVGPGEALGWSWLFPPYRRRFDARAIEPTKGISLEGSCLRGQIEVNQRLGYELLKRFSRIVVERLQAVSHQLLDVYGKHP